MELTPDPARRAGPGRIERRQARGEYGTDGGLVPLSGFICDTVSPPCSGANGTVLTVASIASGKIVTNALTPILQNLIIGPGVAAGTTVTAQTNGPAGGPPGTAGGGVGTYTVNNSQAVGPQATFSGYISNGTSGVSGNTLTDTGPVTGNPGKIVSGQGITTGFPPASGFTAGTTITGTNTTGIAGCDPGRVKTRRG